MRQRVHRLYRLALAVLAALTMGAIGAIGTTTPALAEEIQIENPRIEASDEGYTLSADFDFELNARLEDALQNGVPLVFLIEFEMTRPRWYWFDRRVVERTLRLRLSFHALTRQYRLSSGALHQSFGTLEDALRSIAHLRNWTVLERSQVDAETTYDCALRMRLDVTQLPKPFQVTAFTTRDWTLTSDWKRWRFTPAGVPPNERSAQ